MPAQENNIGNRRLRSSSISAIVSISLVLFMIGLLGLLVLDSKKITDYVKEHVQLTVFLLDDAADADIKSLQQLLARSEFTRTAQYISKQQALDSLKHDLGEDAVKMIESNPLPASIDLLLKAPYANPDSLKKIAGSISKNKIVREVSYQRTEVDRMNENFRTVAMVILIFCGLLLTIAIALINNTIRLSLFSKRFLIKSMQLVGATRGFIRKPFIGRGLINGLYGSLIACILLSGLIYLIQREMPELKQLQDWQIIGTLFISITLFGLLLSGISTLFAVNRYLRLKIDELYY
ncbi:MAG: permease-like cell division protein FtsX [Bacteroidetes bacterium]|nr:permease-like cell division protein FtsX [Bacteroidota bacterium]